MKIKTTAKNKFHREFLSFVISAVLILSAFVPVSISQLDVGMDAYAAVSRHISVENSYEDTLGADASPNWYFFETTTQGSVLIKFETSTLTRTSSWHVNLIGISDSVVYAEKNFGSGEAPASSLSRSESTEKIRIPAGQYRIEVSVPEGYAVITNSYKISVDFISESGDGFESEPNNTINTAANLPLNTAVSGNISYPGDTDYFKIVMPYHGSLSLSFTVSNTINTGNWVVLIYDKDEKQLQMSRAGYIGELTESTRTNKSDRLRLPPGEYYIKIAAYSDALYSAADYKISALYTPERSAQYEKEFNNTAETAGNILLNAAVSGNLNNLDDVDYYKLMIDSHKPVNIEFSTPLAVNQDQWVIYIQNSKGGVAAYNPGQSGVIKDDRHVFTSDSLSLDPGLYNIIIYPNIQNAAIYSSLLNTNEDYILSVLSESDPVPVIYDDTGTEYPTEVPALDYNVNRELSGHIENADDKNIFEFGLNYSGSITVDFQSPISVTRQSWILNIFDKNDKLIYSGKYGDVGTVSVLTGMRAKTSNKIRLPAGSYYIQVLPVNSYDYSNSPYKLTINYTYEAKEALYSNIELYETESNDVPYAANNLNLNSQLTGNLSDYADIDYFMFTLNQSGGVNISFSTPRAVSQNDWLVEIFANNISSPAIYSSYFGAEWDFESLFSDYVTAVSRNMRLRPGIYYLRVSAPNIINYANEDYMIKIDFTEQISGTGLRETELNDTPETASLLDFNEDITGDIFDINDIDYFKISLNKTTEVQLKFSVDSNINVNSWGMKLYSAGSANANSNFNLTELKSYAVGLGGNIIYDGRAGKYFKTEKISLSPGDYYISVAPYSENEFSTEEYILKILDETGQKLDTLTYSWDEPSSWAKPEIELAYGYNLIPQNYMKDFTSPIKREDFCMLIIKYLEVCANKPIAEILSEKNKIINPTIFSDTSDLYILSANALGIVNGRGDGIFDPQGDITREEAATMLMRLGVLENININVMPLAFNDAAEFSSWSTDAISYVSGCMDSRGNRVMNGYTDGSFHHKDTYSREQAYMTIFRIYAIKTGV